MRVLTQPSGPLGTATTRFIMPATTAVSGPDERLGACSSSWTSLAMSSPRSACFPPAYSFERRSATGTRGLTLPDEQERGILGTVTPDGRRPG